MVRTSSTCITLCDRICSSFQLHRIHKGMSASSNSLEFSWGAKWVTTSHIRLRWALPVHSIKWLVPSSSFRDWMLPTLWTHTDAGQVSFLPAHTIQTCSWLNSDCLSPTSRYLVTLSQFNPNLVFDILSKFELFCLSVLMKTQIPIKFFRYLMSGNVNEIWLETFLLN